MQDLQRSDDTKVAEAHPLRVPGAPCEHLCRQRACAFLMPRGHRCRSTKGRERHHRYGGTLKARRERDPGEHIAKDSSAFPGVVLDNFTGVLMQAFSFQRR